MQPMAMRLGIDHQRLQQFVISSSWTVGNVQIGVFVHAVTDSALCPLNWRLFLPTSWDETSADIEEERTQIRTRRDRARLPPTLDTVRRPSWPWR